jgi:hypothetical protein
MLMTRTEILAEGVTLHMGDARVILPTLARADAVVTDPPYGVNKAAWDEKYPVLARYDRATSSWKTSQLCLEGDYQSFSETWPRSGMIRSGTAYQLPPLAPLTKEIGSGLWPTPNTKDGTIGATISADEKITLTMGLPRRGVTETSDGYALTLARMVKLYPTPRAAKRGARSHTTAAAKLIADGRSNHHRLEDALVCIEQITGIPNPIFVEWLMGFPQTWTELASSEMPLSLKYRKLSDEQ